MPEMIENRMVRDSLWENIERRVEKKLRGVGYEEIGTGIFVAEEDAYEYALERISQDEDLQRELVEWFYSRNWIKEG